MVQKASRSDSSSQNSPSPWGDWPEMRGEALRLPTAVSWLLAKGGIVGEKGGSASHTVSLRVWEPGGKGNCSFFDNVVTGRTENKRFSTRPSSGGRSSAVLAVSWERAASHISGLPVSGPLCRLPGRFRGQLGHRGRRAPARGLTRRPRWQFSTGQSRSGGRKRAPTAMSRLSPAPRHSGGRLVHHAWARWVGWPRSASVLPRTAVHSPRQYRQTAQPGRRESRERALCRHRSSQQGWARDGTLGPQVWTSPSWVTAPWFSTPIGRNQSPSAAPASTSGRCYPHAFVLVPWLGVLAG